MSIFGSFFDSRAWNPWFWNGGPRDPKAQMGTLGEIKKFLVNSKDKWHSYLWVCKLKYTYSTAIKLERRDFSDHTQWFATDVLRLFFSMLFCLFSASDQRNPEKKNEKSF